MWVELGVRVIVWICAGRASAVVGAYRVKKSSEASNNRKRFIVGSPDTPHVGVDGGIRPDLYKFTRSVPECPYSGTCHLNERDVIS